MQPEKKKALAALIIAKAKPGPAMDEGSSAEESGESVDEGKMEACGDIIDAVKRGDAEALMHAMNAYIDMRG